MLRRTIGKIIPDYAILPLTLTGINNLIAYNCGKLIQLWVGIEPIDMTGSIDAFFPFHPVWILAYIGSFAFWTYQNIMIARESREQAYRLVAGDFVAKMICLLFFIFLPTTNTRPNAEGSGVFLFITRFIYWVDSPRNLFPSIHCFVAWLGTRQLFEAKKIRHKPLVCTLCVVGSILVFLSTMYTKQHVFVDVIGGIVVAEIGFAAAKYTKLPNLFRRMNECFLASKLFSFLTHYVVQY